MRTRNVLLYDGDCGFCTMCVGFLRRRVRPAAELLPYQQQDLAAYGVTAARASHEVLWITPANTAHGGSRAIAALLRTSPRPWPLLGRLLSLPPLTWAAHATYRLIANNRHRLPSSTCSIAAAPPRR
ncbi:DUF393 domain-containing protein [Actinocorallia sp. A-T 12471]|uniref:thiol-disulfide oxidoreductase DCC family protein n=1 Tax=Actinocorallia sp. A-T 12471 TaxID=3089813 RepID=UPI0029CDE926|nr:DUF393 domain-containing protein [Actinocorallia sp. A-T 12471]MDX6740320.1 DUF393 domain-containing protein [Actinocorallia sp. A-T 12471]